MSSTPKDVLIDAKLAEVEAAIADERIAVAAKKAGMSAREWKKNLRGATKRLYNLAEDRYVLKMMKTWQDKSFYAQAEIIGIRDNQGTFHEASKTRILDWIQVSENQAQGGDIKSSSAIVKSVKGGMSDPDIDAVFRSSSTIEKQRTVENRIWRSAKSGGGKLVIRARDVMTGSVVNFEVDAKDYFKARLTDYSTLPDEVLQRGQRGPISARVPPTVAKPVLQTPETPEPFSKSQGFVELNKAAMPTEPSVGGEPRPITAKRIPELFSQDETGRTVTEAKTTVDRLTASPMTGSANRMTSKLYEKLEKFSSSPKTVAVGFALSFIGGFIEEEAAAERFKQRMERDGYVPVGSEYEVSGEYSTGSKIARLVTDPSIPEKMKALPICLRFDVALWRDGIRRRAITAKYWDTITVRFPVALKDGVHWEGGSAVFQRYPPGDTDPQEWMMDSLYLPSGSLLSKDSNLDLEKIMDPDKDDEWVLKYLRLTEAIDECEKSVRAVRAVQQFGGVVWA